MSPLRLFVATASAAIVMTGTTGAAHAQTSPTNPPNPSNLQSPSGRSIRDYETGYAEGIAESAFGNVTSQSFGAEVGLNRGPRLRIIVEVGRVGDSAAASLGARAQLVASALTSAQSAAVTYSVRQPVFFGLGGVRYMIPYDESFEPYVLGAVGFARVKRDVSWTVGGTDVTTTIATYGVALGSDLAGTSTNLMWSGGAGVLWNVRTTVFFDLQYRYGRVSDEGQGININRVGAGIGVRF